MEDLTNLAKIEPKYARIDGNTDNMNAVPFWLDSFLQFYCLLLTDFSPLPTATSLVPAVAFAVAFVTAQLVYLALALRLAAAFIASSFSDA